MRRKEKKKPQQNNKTERFTDPDKTFLIKDETHYLSTLKYFCSSTILESKVVLRVPPPTLV